MVAGSFHLPREVVWVVKTTPRHSNLASLLPTHPTWHKPLPRCHTTQATVAIPILTCRSGSRDSSLVPRTASIFTTACPPATLLPPSSIQDLHNNDESQQVLTMHTTHPHIPTILIPPLLVMAVPMGCTHQILGNDNSNPTAIHISTTSSRLLPCLHVPTRPAFQAARTGLT